VFTGLFLVSNGHLQVETRENAIVDVTRLEEGVPGTWSDEANAIAVAPDHGDRTLQPGQGSGDLERFRQGVLFMLRTAADGRVNRNNDHVLALFFNVRDFERGH
jgi:hypothetical protein